MKKPCAQCGDLLEPIEYTIFRFSKDGMKPYYSKWCRTCQNENKLILKEIKKNHRPPPSGTPCQCCGRIDKLHPDHCRHTRTLRGWICRNCNAGIGMLGDVDLDVRIELGRTQMLVDDVLRLSPESVVELDKAAGDPVDIYVNGRHVARGEVLVLNENFCVRVSEIVGHMPEADAG